MNYQEILSLIDSSEQEPRSLCRIYMFAAASDLHNLQLDELRKEICHRLNMEEKEFTFALQGIYDDWSRKLARTDSRLEGTEWVENFARRNRPALLNSSLGLEEAKKLLIHLFSLTLQRVSILTYHNHLKRKDIRILMNLLTSEKHLKKYAIDLERPIMEVAKGTWPATSAQYLNRSLAYAQCLAYYYLYFLLDGKGARCQCVLQVIHQIHHWSLEEVISFLHPVPSSEVS